MVFTHEQTIEFINTAQYEKDLIGKKNMLQTQFFGKIGIVFPLQAWFTVIQNRCILRCIKLNNSNILINSKGSKMSPCVNNTSIHQSNSIKIILKSPYGPWYGTYTSQTINISITSQMQTCGKKKGFSMMITDAQSDFKHNNIFPLFQSIEPIQNTSIFCSLTDVSTLY